MFIQPCFIRKNTPELRKKLEELGYKMGPIYSPNEQNLYVGGGTYASANFIDNYYLDCGDNEELFLALAALRDDSDYMQWFVCPKTQIKRKSGWFGQIIGMDGHYREIVGYEWHKHENNDNALTERLNTMILMEIEDMEFLPHKATVEEIIEHFKSK